jgi:hypothetical protein
VRNRIFLALSIAVAILATGCVAVPAGRIVYGSPAPAVVQSATCQQVAWDGEKWICATAPVAITTETVVIDNVLYGVVGGLIVGYWINNVWHHGVPNHFVPRHGYRVAPRGYTVVPRGHAIPRGFYGRRR